MAFGAFYTASWERGRLARRAISAVGGNWANKLIEAAEISRS